MKKTLAHPGDSQHISDRLYTLTPEDHPLWGRMNPQQALCHLTEAFKVPTGEIPAAPANTPPIPFFLFKWLALQAPFKWRPGFKTVPELESGTQAIPTRDFGVDRQRCLNALADFLEHKSPWAPHPFFRQLSTSEWMRWGYLHCDHHLRQFGR